MKYKKLLLVILLLGACHPLRGCVESEFTLSPESRLPKWFASSQGQNRNDISVTLTYYNSNTVKLSLRDLKTGKITDVIGRMKWHTETEKKKNKYGGYDPASYPHYRIITANAIKEIIEHRKMEPYFYISDDPSLTKAIENKK